MRDFGIRWVSVGLVAIALGACGGPSAAQKPADNPAVSSTAPSEDDKSLPNGQDIPPDGSPSKAPTSESASDAADPAPPPRLGYSRS